MTNSKWMALHISIRQSPHHILSYYDQQLVSHINIAHCVKDSFLTSFPMTNRKWVTLHILWKAVQLHLFLWSTGSESHCIFYEKQPHPMTNRKSVTLYFWQSHHIFPITNRKWVTCTLCERQSPHIFFYDQQEVSNIAHFIKGSLITSFPMTNRLWVVTLHISWKAVSSHLFPMTNRKQVTFHILCKAVSSHLFPMTNRE